MNDAVERAKANFKEDLEETPPPVKKKEPKKPLAVRPLYWVSQIIIIVSCFLIFLEFQFDYGNPIKHWAALMGGLVVIGMVINFLHLIWILVIKKD